MDIIICEDLFMCKILILVVLLVVILIVVLVVDGLSYIYVEVGWIQIQVNDDYFNDLKVDGGYICGLFVIVEQVYVFGVWLMVFKKYNYVDGSLKLELNQLELGIGYYMLMSDCVDFIVDIVWVCQNVEVKLIYDGFGIVCEKDYINGGCVSMGVCGKFLLCIEVWLKVGYLDGSDMDGIWIGIFGGQVNFIKVWGLVGEVQVYEDVIQYLVGVCVSF